MAPNTNVGDVEFVILKCVDSNRAESEPEEEGDESEEEEDTVAISTSEINSWNLPSILTHKCVQIKADRNRIIDNSSYFRGLFSGSFSESGRDSVSIRWNMRSFLSVMKFMFGCSVDVASDNFVPLYEAALFFGVETLLSRCLIWLREVTSNQELSHPQLQVDALIDVWNYGIDANDLIPQLCISYLARNFMWAMTCSSFVDIPYQLLYLCIQHTFLTVDSEKNLCDGILLWLAANIQQSGNLSTTEDSHTGILQQIRCNLLPLWFLTGKRRRSLFAKFADESVDHVLRLARDPVGMGNILGYGPLCMTIRLTEYTKKVDLSGCPQIRHIILFSLLPSLYDEGVMHRKNLKLPLLDLHHLNVDLLPTLTFEAVEEVDVSNCPMLDLEDAVKCLCKSFPSFKKLSAAKYVSYKIEKLNHLLERCPLLCDVDLTVDISPLVPAKVSIISASTTLDRIPSNASLSSISRSHIPRFSNIVRLILEGRGETTDSDLHNIAGLCASLCYLNINGCISVTDTGISFVILNCLSLHSLLACDTSFGQKSVLALCSGGPVLELDEVGKALQSLACKLQTLHIGGCREVTETSLSELLSQTRIMGSFCLRETQLVDDALYCFPGSLLKALDVSETKVSGHALAHLICRNPGLKCLKARGCKHLSLAENKIGGREFCTLPYTSKELYSELGRSCRLEEIAVGWGFSWFSLQTLNPAIRSLRIIVVGLGASLGIDGLKLLPAFCPSLETLILFFQVISDSVIVSILQTIRQLQVLELCYCLGEISSLSFQFSLPSLRKLKLERVTTWMTNADLITLSQNCMNLVELSLLGCKLLNQESQDIISSGWPGLISIHLEDCGEITAYGISSLMNCRALEDLLLRHTGPGIPRNVIPTLASEMPMLRKISLDMCDAEDHDFDIIDFSSRCFLSSVKIARCKVERCNLDLPKLDVHGTPVHKETLLLVWDSKKLTRSVVKERL